MGEGCKDLPKLANGLPGLTSELSVPASFCASNSSRGLRILPECRFLSCRAGERTVKSQREGLFHFFLFVSLRRIHGLTGSLPKTLKHNGLRLTRHYFQKVRFGHKGAPY
jgi:hypothetical protein